MQYTVFRVDAQGRGYEIGACDTRERAEALLRPYACVAHTRGRVYAAPGRRLAATMCRDGIVTWYGEVK